MRDIFFLRLKSTMLKKRWFVPWLWRKRVGCLSGDFTKQLINTKGGHVCLRVNRANISQGSYHKLNTILTPRNLSYLCFYTQWKYSLHMSYLLAIKLKLMWRQQTFSIRNAKGSSLEQREIKPNGNVDQQDRLKSRRNHKHLGR